MRNILLGSFAVLCGANLALAQPITITTQKIGNQVITDIQPIKPAKLGEIKPDYIPSATATVIKIKSWNLGRIFNDDKGQRWRLVRGDSVTRYPRQLSGWRVLTVEGEECFLAIDGRLYTLD